MDDTGAGVLSDDVAARVNAPSSGTAGPREVNRGELPAGKKKPMLDAAGDVPPHDVALWINPESSGKTCAREVNRTERCLQQKLTNAVGPCCEYSPTETQARDLN